MGSDFFFEEKTLVHPTGQHSQFLRCFYCIFPNRIFSNYIILNCIIPKCTRGRLTQPQALRVDFQNVSRWTFGKHILFKPKHWGFTETPNKNWIFCQKLPIYLCIYQHCIFVVCCGACLYLRKERTKVVIAGLYLDHFRLRVVTEAQCWLLDCWLRNSTKMLLASHLHVSAAYHSYLEGSPTWTTLHWWLHMRPLGTRVSRVLNRRVYHIACEAKEGEWWKATLILCCFCRPLCLISPRLFLWGWELFPRLQLAAVAKAEQHQGWEQGIACAAAACRSQRTQAPA